eukprot:scpid65382/ scgid12368/ 
MIMIEAYTIALQRVCNSNFCAGCKCMDQHRYRVISEITHNNDNGTHSHQVVPCFCHIMYPAGDLACRKLEKEHSLKNHWQATMVDLACAASIIAAPMHHM